MRCWLPGTETVLMSVIVVCSLRAFRLVRLLIKCTNSERVCFDAHKTLFSEQYSPLHVEKHIHEKVARSSAGRHDVDFDKYYTIETR